MVKKENTTKSFVLRVDADTMEAIEKWAADEFRSTNGQLQWILYMKHCAKADGSPKEQTTGNNPSLIITNQKYNHAPTDV